MKVILTVVSGPQARREFAFSNYDTFTVGRSRKATFCVSGDRAFSRIHFLIELNPPECRLKNLSLTGGTLVNGKQVADATLRDGDIISGGRETRIQVQIELSGEKTETVERPVTAGLGSATDMSAKERGSQTLPRFPGYEVLSELGQGGMGTVYLATRSADGSPVAIKTMIPQSATSQKSVALFMREIDVLSQLEHPNIVRLIAAWQSGTPGASTLARSASEDSQELGPRSCVGLVSDRPERGGDEVRQLYFVMEYVAGRNLEQLTKETAGNIEIRRAVRLFDQVFEGLSYAHGQGYVHRDIKGHNILVAGHGSREAVKLSDFGLARSFEQAGLSGLTRTGDRRGTFAFMAPEQLLNARLADPRSDLYSAAATLYRLLTGQHLWNPNSELRDPLLQILHEDPVPVQQRRPDVPDGLAWVIHKALNRDPQRRFAEAEAMRQAMRAEV